MEQPVQIILIVKEGRGFEFVGERNPIVVSGSLENQSLDTTVTSSTDPHFGNELVWESDKKAIRRLRTAKVPLKVECFALVGINPQKRVKIGFTLLNLCSALIETRGKANSTATAKWYKLICSHARGCNPEILLSLKIETADDTENEELLFTSARHTRMLNTNQSQVASNTVPVPMKKVKEIILVGPALMSTDVFQLSVEVESANLSSLFVHDSIDTSNRLYFICKAFGKEFSSEADWTDSNEHSTPIEKVTFHIQSSLSFIQQYLQNNSHFTLRLMAGKHAVGLSEINVSKLVPNDHLSDAEVHRVVDNTVMSKNRCTLKSYNSIGLPDEFIGDGSNGNTYLNVKTQLTHCQSMPIAADELADCLSDNRSSFAEKIMEAGGDRQPSRESLSSFAQELLPINPQQKKPVSTPEIPTQKYLKTVFSQSEQTLQKPTFRRVYNTFTLDIVLQSVLFHKFPPQNKIFFKFHHPKAEVITSTHPETMIKQLERMISLDHIQCKLRFVSTPEEISRLLLAHPPKISACATISDEVHQLAIATLDVARLLSDKKQCIYPAPMIDLVEGDELGLVYILMNLENCGEQVEDRILRPLPSEQDLGPAILDDRIAYQIIRELEEWKERQQEMFRSELARKEDEHLKRLMEEFQKRRDALKLKLDENLQQSQTLRETLRRASEEYELKSIQQAEEGRELTHRKEELERSYNVKFQDLREASKRMEDDLNHEMKMMENKISDLEETVEKLVKENHSLRKSHGKDSEDLQRSTLTKDQTASLLLEMKLMGEKLDSASKSKTFFKEQWARAVREIHRIKNEHQEAVQIQIRDFKDELKSLGFQRLLDNEESDLEDDRKILQQVRSDLIRDSESYEDYAEKLNAMFAPPKLLACSSNQSIRSTFGSAQEQENNNKAKIRQLVDERDALLRTGNYSMNDSVIHKLHTEIRRLQNTKPV